MDELGILENAEETATIVRNFATIGAVYADGVSLIFDGEDAPTEKHYLCNTNVYFSPGDRVRILEDSGTYIVEYVVGSPKQSETVGIPEGGTTGQALRKTSGENYSASWQNVNEVPTSGTTGYVLTKTTTGYSWKAVPTEVDISLLTNGSNTVGLTSATLFAPSVTSSTSAGISIGSSSYWFKNLYAGGNYGSVHLCQSTSNSTLSFFGATAQSRLTLSTTSANQGYTSATSSNYLNIINNIAGILKKYGLIG